MKMRLAVSGAALILALNVAFAQGTGGFDLQAYQLYLSNHQNLEPAQLLSEYPAGRFSAGVTPCSTPPEYLGTIDLVYALTADERAILDRNGFVATERLSSRTMVEAFGDIYSQDLPVFISSDAILEALHYSYDLILKQVEKTILAPQLSSLLASLRSQVPVLAGRYSHDAAMTVMLHDLDVYLTVPAILLGNAVTPYYADNESTVADILTKIAAQTPEDVALFGSTPRKIDFSQFIVRGHYTQDSLLSKYFKSMIWLGRTELYLIPPEHVAGGPSPADVQRQAIDAALVLEAVGGANAYGTLDGIDTLVAFLVGESDNVTVRNLSTVFEEAGVDSASALLDTTLFHAFQDSLRGKPFAFQRINSQLLKRYTFDPGQIRPASAFMLLGQRFVIDSFITGNVVYDRIVYHGLLVERMMPSTLDVLFALGNSATAQLLEPELEAWKYSTNLATLRYLVDAYDEEFWRSSLFNNWLAILRSLNPPETRTELPAFMQTAAWWQEKMNTQLASWAQLRHDNLLYAKQSYTPIPICSYPSGYVEPIPEFYERVETFADIAATRFGAMGLADVESYFRYLLRTAATLDTIARHELAGTPLSADENDFLRKTAYAETGCVSMYLGWYPQLFYSTSFLPSEPERNLDYTVADVHTVGLTGAVLHAGTGPVNLAVVATEIPGGRCRAFIGPLLSYYERVEVGFNRLTDQQWRSLYDSAPTYRPQFVNIYLADESGKSRGSGPSLWTGVSDDRPTQPSGAYALYQNFPNPFNPSTFISFTVPGSSSGTRVVLEIFDVSGRRVAALVDAALPGGNYVVRWNGKTLAGAPAASGAYFYRLKAGTFSQARKLLLLR